VRARGGGGGNDRDARKRDHGTIGERDREA
jgi:hypothetical protein